MVLGHRVGFGKEEMDPHDVTMTVLGAGLLWFGWFGFNAGSALAADGLAAQAFVTTNTTAAMAALTWLTVSWAHKGHPSVIGAAAGAVSGLVAITPAAGFVDVPSAVLIGLGAGVICYWAIQLTRKLKVDDALDVFGVHGVGGTWGALATGLFAQSSINPNGADGLLFGNPDLFVKQIIAVAATWVFAGGMTFLIMKLIDVTIGLRVPEREEVLGLDVSQHGETAYQLT